MYVYGKNVAHEIINDESKIKKAFLSKDAKQVLITWFHSPKTSI